MIRFSFRFLFSIVFYFSVISMLISQYTYQDTLRGSIGPERVWWDLTHYHLDIEVNPGDSTISGSNTISYDVLEENNVLQIDLQSPLKINRVVQNGLQLNISSDGNAHFIHLDEPQIPGHRNELTVYYSGKPHVAIRAPWDGGISWKYDHNGNPFVASSCQGIGASIWWPCKDHMYDEPDSMMISVTTPSNLMNISNGQLVSREAVSANKVRYSWKVNNPINNYGVNLSIGDYVHFGEIYQGLNGPLKLDYYVLRDNLEKAKSQFREVPLMMEAFEHWFGPYPFYEDGFKLIEVPYLGMEHQSAVTYGNGYQNGYLGRDLSGTGWGLKFDFIIIHEAGHEWFANNITYRDIADMWIHESFTAYSECLYLEYFHGKEAGAEYVIGTRRNIMNDRPIIGEYGVNARGSGDMYYKGSNMLHTLRQIVNDDEKWKNLLVELNHEFFHQTVTTDQIEGYMEEFLGISLQPFFDQYLRSATIPILSYGVQEERLFYRWINAKPGLEIPVKIFIDDEPIWITVGNNMRSKKLESNPEDIRMDKNFYMGSMDIFGN